MRCRPSWSLSTLGSKHACDKNRRSSVTYASISVFPPHPIPSPRTTKYVVCFCFLHIKSRSDLYSVPSAGTMPNSLYRMPLVYLSLTCVFCYSCSFLLVVFFCVFVFFFCSHWSLVDVPLIFFCPADHVPDWQPRVLLGMVEARSVNVKKTTTPSNIRIAPTDANAFRGHRLTTQKG